MIQITFLGGADEVGASCLLLEIAGRRLLIDAGIRISPKSRWGLQDDQLPDLSLIDRAGGVDAILVTHAHTDHTGALELIVERYPCPIYATPITIALSRVLHADARRIMQSRQDEEGELPLYDDWAVQKFLDVCVPVPFRTRLPLGEGVSATFFPAGHIAGAAMIGLESAEGRVLVTGDLALTPQRSVDGARVPPFHPDLLVIESTYGARLHANRAAEERRLVSTVAEVTAAGGKVLIPAFALGRAQEVLLILSEARRQGIWTTGTLWADGMVRAICQTYAQFPETLPLLLQERGAQFFDSHTHPVESARQRQDLLWDPEPWVMVASSGMLSGGPSMAYARQLARQPQNAILLTGYQDEESPGRQLLRLAETGSGTLRLGPDKVDVQCRLDAYSLSAHADEGQLINLVNALDPAEVCLVHGDEAARDSLAARLRERQRPVHLPQAGQTLTFQFGPPPGRSSLRAIGAGRPPDTRSLWGALIGPAGGGYFTLRELIQAWWGDAAGPKEAAELQARLEKGDPYFEVAAHRPELYWARTAAQIELARQRREQLAAFALETGRIVLLRDEEGTVFAAQCSEVGEEHFYIAGDPDPRGPETLLATFDPGPVSVAPAEIESLAATFAPDELLPPGRFAPLAELAATLPGSEAAPAAREAALALALLRAGAEITPEGYRRPQDTPATAAPSGQMEPNQALARVRERLPADARLRRCGYRLEQGVLTLGFDFPEPMQARYGALLDTLARETGWQLELDPQVNQAALNGLAQEVLRDLGLQSSKGPSLHLAEKEVHIKTGPIRDPAACRDAAAEFRDITGFTLVFKETGGAAPVPAAVSIPTEARWEINAAYNEIRRALEGSSLYRTSLKGERIVLSFVSAQVGQRYAATLADLESRLGWPLEINPQPNQGQILQVARDLIAQAGWEIAKGPGIYLDQALVTVRLAQEPEASQRETVQQAFTERTGYRLELAFPISAAGIAPPPKPSEAEILIPIDRIQLQAFQHTAELKSDKLEQAVRQARQSGSIQPPIRVRRLAQGYLLLDGLYRLHAARRLGWTRIQAIVE